MAHLFDPLKLRGVEFANRIVVSPMCQYSCTDGFANDWHFVHLGSRAVGRAAAVIAEATAITADSRISPQDLGIWTDAHIEPLRRISHLLPNKAPSRVFNWHTPAERQAPTSPGMAASPSLQPKEDGRQFLRPARWHLLTAIRFRRRSPWRRSASIIEAFAAAARRAQAAGAKLIELHSAHGYLLHSFLSPLSNQRTDQYGGSFANRIRIVCEVVTAVRKVWPEQYPLWVRVSATDWTEGGWTPEESVELARTLKPLGVDLIDCSSGGNVARAKIPVGPGYQVAFAEKIRREAGIPTGAVGMITDPAQADQIIRSGQADVVILARQFLRDPYWPLTGRTRSWTRHPMAAAV